jgi:hypothetical protein
MNTNTPTPTGVVSSTELGERTCEQGCNGRDDCTDYDQYDAECDRCHGDGRDPWNDYMLPCHLCGGRDSR